MPDVSPLAGIKGHRFYPLPGRAFCMQILGDYGAEVIKIEPVKGARAEMGGYTGKDSYFFMSTNRSKKSVQIDLRQPAGRDVMLRLADQADVVIDNFVWRDGSDGLRLRNARRAQPAHHRMLDLRLRRERSDARYARIRPNRARLLRTDERDGHRGERPDAGRDCDLRSARRDLRRAGYPARAPGTPTQRPRPAGRDFDPRSDRQRAQLVSGHLL